MKRHRAKIVIVPLGDVDYFQINKLSTTLSARFGHSVDILQGIKVPNEAYDLIKGQYFATMILQKLELLKANEKEKILGVIEDDIYNTRHHVLVSDVDAIGGTALVSMFQLKQQFYGLPDDEKMIYQRLVKEATRMVGALFSIPFCRNPKCVMFYSEDMFDIDQKSEKFCDICKRAYMKVM
jgi:archaemetzincin